MPTESLKSHGTFAPNEPFHKRQASRLRVHEIQNYTAVLAKRLVRYKYVCPPLFPFIFCSSVRLRSFKPDRRFLFVFRRTRLIRQHSYCTVCARKPFTNAYDPRPEPYSGRFSRVTCPEPGPKPKKRKQRSY